MQEVGTGMGDAPLDNKPFELIWTSQNGVVTIPCGRYESIPDAEADRDVAESRLHELYPASEDFHFPHDIRAGTWRVVPAELPPPRRNKP
jgi:hypothetical protein